MNRITVKDSAELAARELAEYLARSVIHSDKKLNIALSGGNSPKTAFREMTKLLNDPAHFAKVNFYWVDERCVAPESEESNYGEFKRIYADAVNFPQSNMFPMDGANDPKREAQRYSALLKDNLPESNGLPLFDIIVLGMGDDGHTASIFPDRMDLFESDKTVAVAKHPKTKQHRITLTGPVIMNAIEAIALVAGKNKSAVLKEVFEKRPESLKYPISIVYGERNVAWILDDDSTLNF